MLKATLLAALKIGEIITLRAVPGLVNLWSIIILGKALGSAQFGYYSTAAAAVVVISGLLFGPIIYGLVGQYADHNTKGSEKQYLSAISAFYCLVSFILLAGAVSLWWIAARYSLIIMVAIPVSVYTLAQEVLRVRLQLWKYAFCSFVQSTLFLCFAILGTGNNVDYSIALVALGCSYAIACLPCLAFARIPKPTRGFFSIISPTMNIGLALTLSQLAESVLYLGVRLLLATSAPAQALSAFSFCADLAQKSVGFFVNAASFAFVPLAFRHSARNDDVNFKKALLDGGLASGSLGLMAMSCILAVHYMFPNIFLPSELFDPLLFLFLSIATLVNRLIKLTLTPFAVKSGRPGLIARAYTEAAAIGILASAVMIASGKYQEVGLIYCLGYNFCAVRALQLLKSMKVI